ncbi:protein argonaute 12-like [Triticum aestivum]|uniref:protein argonaute 12-like n=1 Tax=Triticum aestivum TaxID=4565 RepID=UPI001D001FF2|nr:protein argonaute 12-like [Triticum aestivum]
MGRRLAVSEAVQGSSSSAPAAAATGAQESQTQMAVVVPPRNLPPASSKSTEFPARPGYGTAGKRCRVRANHLLVQVADKEIYHYDVRNVSLLSLTWYSSFGKERPLSKLLGQTLSPRHGYSGSNSLHATAVVVVTQL